MGESAPAYFYTLMSLSQKRSYLFAGLAILCWSSVSTAFKLGLMHLTPVGLLFTSAFVATLFLAISYALSPGSQEQGLIPNLYKSLPAGLLNPFLYYLVLFSAYSRLRAQEAQALNYTWAIVLTLLSALLLKQRFRLKDLIALLFSFAGVIVISTRGQVLKLHFDDAGGTLLAIGSSVIWALYWIINLKDARRDISKLFFNFLVGFLLIAVYVVLSKSPLLLPEANILDALLYGVWVGIFEMGLTFVLWLQALKLTQNTASISNLIFITPFLSMLLIREVLGEPIHPATIIGLVMIVVSNLYQKI